MKALLSIVALLIINSCFSQEPTPFGFNFKILDNKGEIIPAGKLKQNGLQVFVTGMKQFQKCADGKKDSFPATQLSYSVTKKMFVFDRIFSPSQLCEPAFVLVRNRDTMFIKLAAVLNYSCYQHLPNGSEINPRANCNKAFIITFKKGYFVDYSSVQTLGESDLKQYFNDESADNFCHWQEVK